MAAQPKAGAIPSVWARAKPAPSQPALSRALIVREAIAMLDADGIEALSMRKLGARLNAGATSLYRHVALKDELMELALDEVLGEVAPPPEDPADWRTAVTDFAASFRATALRHPWMCTVLGQAGLAYLGPHLSALSQRLSTLFTNAGFPDPGTAINALYSYAIGMVTTELAWLNTVARSRQTEADFLARLLPPASHEGQSGTQAADPRTIRDDHFDNALELVLDGLACQLTR
ncbi:TetR/AcrR family transcriptional regulator C-terminal domain-containing protein [Streptomyces sp. cmx-4-9]|uniref:TetR/AcrR family transcriptional regulator C-terminal domain-containing protein n=1 Tax=Streptomyces sp. cmx-4-9 TaxID=2790941 RepID=UPI00397F0E7E